MRTGLQDHWPHAWLCAASSHVAPRHRPSLNVPRPRLAERHPGAPGSLSAFQFGSSFRISDAKAKGFFTRCVISWIRSCCRPIRLMASGYRRAHEIIADQIIAQSVKRQVTGGFGRGSGRRSSLRGKLWFISGFPICGTILTGSVP